MKRKLAYIVDSWSLKSAHEVINQGYLMMISDLYERVIYVANQSSIVNLKNLLKACKVEIENVEFVEIITKRFNVRPGCLSGLLNALTISYENNKVFRQTPKGADVFYNNNFHFTSLFNIWFNGANNRAFYLCHAEMELIRSSKDRGYFAALFKYYLRFLFRVIHLPENSKFILLSEGMATKFQTLVSEKNKNNIFGIDHCYLRPVLAPNLSLKEIKFSGIKIGISGSITKERGLDTLKVLLSSYNNINAKIFSISSISENIDNDKFEIINKTNGQLPFEEYAGYVQQMDAFLFLYDFDSYQLSASGALLEAIWNEKPIIALKNAYFENMFEKFGSMGYLADSIEEFVNIVNNLSTNNIELFKVNIIKAKKQLLPQNVTQYLKEIIEA